jgi:hypothetical protein
MASISSNSKVTTLPSNARTSEAAKPASASPQVAHAPPAPATPVSEASGFDPNSSFFPHSLPVGDAPATEARRVPQWARWIGAIAGVLLLAGAFLYYYLQMPAGKGAAVESRSARTSPLNAGASAKPVRGGSAVAVEAQPHDAQSRVTHTLPGDASPSDSPAVVRTQDRVPASASAAKPDAPVPTPTLTPALPRVTHTQSSAPAPAKSAEEPHQAAPAVIEVKKAECSGPAAVLGLCAPLRTGERK